MYISFFWIYCADLAASRHIDAKKVYIRGYKTAKKVYFDAKKVYIEAKKVYVFDEKVYNIYKTIAKKFTRSKPV